MKFSYYTSNCFEHKITPLFQNIFRLSVKLHTFQEISNSFEEMATTPAFQIVQENLLRTFLKIFQDTVPQFIGENNTQVQ